MNEIRSGFTTQWYVPPKEERPVVELTWNLGNSHFVIAEIADDPIRNRRVLNFWDGGKQGVVHPPLFEFLESLTEAHAALLESSSETRDLKNIGNELWVKRESSRSVGIFCRRQNTRFACVRFDREDQLTLELWEQDESRPHSLPLHETMIALLEASIRLGQVQASLAT